MIRTQVFLTKDELSFLDAAAKQRKTTKSEIIRESLDSHLGIKRISKEEFIESVKKSIGVCKGMNLKKRIRELRKHW